MPEKTLYRLVVEVPVAPGEFSHPDVFRDANRRLWRFQQDSETSMADARETLVAFLEAALAEARA